MTLSTRFFLSGLGLLALLPASAAPRPLPAGSRKPATTRPGSPARPQAENGTHWTREPWTGDDRPYQKIRAEIEARAARKELTKALVEQYRSRSQAARTDPKALYRWAFSWYQASKAEPPVRPRIQPGPLAFARPPSPRAYEYARLRFLMVATHPDPSLRAVGERLLKRKPTDSEVKYAFLRVLDPMESMADKERGLQYAQELIQQFPERANPYGALGGIYYRSWWKRRDPEDAQRAIAAMEQYLIRSKDREWSKEVRKIIEYVKAHSAK